MYYPLFTDTLKSRSMQMAFGGVYGSRKYVMTCPRLTYIKCWNGNTLAKHFRPYVKDGVPCFKEEVSGTYVYNSGEGKLIMGERITENS